MNESMEKALTKSEENLSAGESQVAAGFSTVGGFNLLLRQAKWLSSSDLVPKEFRGNAANCVIALEMANRLQASPLAVIQNLYLVHGKPSWSAQFIIAAVNSTGKFTPLRFDVTGEGDDKTCVAWANEKATGTRLEGPPVSISIAKKEGWYGKTGSKWQTMEDLMLRYRAATFFGRLYAPEILMGMQTMDEIIDTIDLEPDEYETVAEKTETKAEVLKEKIRTAKKKPAEPVEKLFVVPPEGCEFISAGEAKKEDCEVRQCREGCPAWN
jgi:hypothetical protein